MSIIVDIKFCVDINKRAFQYSRSYQVITIMPLFCCCCCCILTTPIILSANPLYCSWDQLLILQNRVPTFVRAKVVSLVP